MFNERDEKEEENKTNSKSTTRRFFIYIKNLRRIKKNKSSNSFYRQSGSQSKQAMNLNIDTNLFDANRR